MSFTLEEGDVWPWIEKAPQAELDYGFDWSRWLASGDTISDAEWTVPTGLSKDGEGSDNSSTSVSISGGTVGTRYVVSCDIETAQGRVDHRSFEIRCVER